MSAPDNQEHGIQIENMYLRVQLYLNPVVPETADFLAWGQYPLHTHPFHELFFCEGGPLEIQTKEECIRLQPGDIAILPADVEHVKLPTPPQIRWNSVSFSYFKRQTRGSQDIFSAFNRGLSKHEPIVVRCHPELTARLFRMIENASQSVPRFLALNMTDVLSHVLDSLYDGAHGVGKEAPSRGDVDIDSIARLEVLIFTKYMDDISTEAAAKHFHISARQLDRITHRRFGVTFRQAVINRRLQVAIEMFSATRMTIEEIGLAVGFSSRLSFSRAFRARYGTSPQQYRKTHCGNG